MRIGEFNGRRLYTGLSLYYIVHPHRALSLSSLFAFSAVNSSFFARSHWSIIKTPLFLPIF